MAMRKIIISYIIPILTLSFLSGPAIAAIKKAETIALEAPETKIEVNQEIAAPPAAVLPATPPILPKVASLPKLPPKIYLPPKPPVITAPPAVNALKPVEKTEFKAE
jgi:hypothetical protein